MWLSVSVIARNSYVLWKVLTCWWYPAVSLETSEGTSSPLCMGSWKGVSPSFAPYWSLVLPCISVSTQPVVFLLTYWGPWFFLSFRHPKRKETPKHCVKLKITPETHEVCLERRRCFILCRVQGWDFHKWCTPLGIHRWIFIHKSCKKLHLTNTIILPI